MMTVGAATSVSAPSVVKAETLQQESELPRTIEVQGLDRSISKSTLMDYFGNRRSSGGEIKEIDFDSNAGRAKITFQDVNGKHN